MRWDLRHFPGCYHKKRLSTFSTKAKQEVLDGLQSLKASVEQETETGFLAN